MNDVLLKNSVAPLILRLALAAIFIYHGFHKIADKGNDWGTVWATNLARQSEQPPADVMARLQQWTKLDAELRNQGKRAKDEQPQLPADVDERIKTAYAELNAPGYIGKFPTAGAVHLSASAQLLVAWGELLGGIALLLGLLTRVAAVGLIIIQVGAIALVTGRHGFYSPEAPGYEYNIALIGACLALVFLGGGEWSVNRCLPGLRRAERVGPRAEPAATSAPSTSVTAAAPPPA